jgi:hypothetical protein
LITQIRAVAPTVSWHSGRRGRGVDIADET